MADPRQIVYSAHTLQAFVDCERRFELQYLDRMTWPAVPASPPLVYEQLMADGRRFHQMVQQDLLDAPVLEPTAIDRPCIATWWENYGMYDPASEVAGRRLVERMLVGAIGPAGPPLVAKYDLIVWTGEVAVIFDWKTSPHKAERRNLLDRLQTRVYRYLLASAGAQLTGGVPIPPEAIQMVYWYAMHPEDPELIAYDAEAYARDERYLLDLVDRIERRQAEEHFALTERERTCQLCIYRSFCGRGRVAGELTGNEADEYAELDIDLLGDLDAIEAIAFH
ncbi:MAG: PD-(D/E)XK nuclease family protein [Rhodothermales bacterium]|nr:PD-(D/E)XK nuclease family protein [Rhodothermales bacterium]